MADALYAGWLHWLDAVRALERRGIYPVSSRTKLEKMGIPFEEYENAVNHARH